MLHRADRKRGSRKRSKGIGVGISRDELRWGGGECEEWDTSGLHSPRVGVEGLGHLPGEKVGEYSGRVACGNHL